MRALVFLVALTSSAACDQHRADNERSANPAASIAGPALSPLAVPSTSASATNGFSLVEAERQPTVYGYRHCSLHALAACENSNQLFWGESDRRGNSTPKREIRDALDRFLKGAPTHDIQTNVARDVGDGLVGPGLSQHLAGGEWFFSGFTPHAAMLKAAALFDARGNIIAVALLDDNGDTASLCVYSHGALRTDRLARFRRWARDAASATPSRLDNTVAVELGTKDWITRPLS
jgi:hypothetical protein